MPDDTRAALTEWRKTTLGDAATYINGYAFKPDDWSERGLPIVRIAQMTDPAAYCDHYEGELPAQYRIGNGDLLFSWSATLSTLIWDRGPAYLNQHLFKVIPAIGTELAFLHHLLDFHMDGLSGQAHGTTMRHIKRSDLLPFAVDLPPLREQRRIAEGLDTLDEAIRRTEQIIAKLKQMKQGLLHDLLTRGIDENGELRDPQRRPEQFKISPLGLVPKAWKVAKLSSLYSEPSRNGLYKRPRFHGRGPLMIQMGGIFSGFFASTDGASRVEVTPSELRTYGLREGDLLFARRSLVLEGAGKCALAGCGNKLAMRLIAFLCDVEHRFGGRFEEFGATV